MQRKTVAWLIGTLWCVSSTLVGQSLHIKERGAHHRVVENLVATIDDAGQSITITNTYTELEIGLHYQDAQGGWVEASDELEIIDGKAIGNKALHQVAFEPNIATPGAITLVTPEGQILRSHILGLSYFDPTTGQSVLIAEVKNTIGEVHGRNQVIYHDAFDDVVADVRYTFTKAGFEQDVILRAAPPAPEEFGLNPETVQLQVLTEFIQPPAPQQRPSLITGLTSQRSGQAVSAVQDVELDFGSMRIGTGKAFSTDDDVMDGSLPSTRGVGVPVGKEWTKLEGRDFLIESVSYPTIQAEVEALPTNTKEEASIQKIKTRRVVSNARKLPVREASAGLGGSIKAVQASVAKRPGLVIDYATISANQNPYTFQGDTTYHVTGDYTMSGTVTLEGGAVIKYNANAQLRISGTFVCLTSPYRPAIFTAKDDNTVGENISGSTGNPTGTYASSALYFTVVSDLHHARFNHCYQAVYYHNGVAASTLRHVQIVKSTRGIQPNNTQLSVRNVLMEDVTTCFINNTTSTVGVEHLTVFQTGATSSTMIGAGSTITMNVTNSLLAALTSTTGFTKVNTETPSSSSGLFFTAGAGKGYLASSTYRNKGVMEINPDLLKDLRQKTTYPPVILSSVTYTQPTLLSLTAQRDTDDPDLGYHYSPIDYAVNEVVITNTTVVLTNGVAVVVYGDNGFKLKSGGKLVSEGTPLKMNQIVRYQAVQENSSVWGANGFSKSLIANDGTMSVSPIISLRFTHLSAPHLNSSSRCLIKDAGYAFNPLTIRDSHLHGGWMTVQNYNNNSQSSKINLTNNIFERATLSVYNKDTTYNCWSLLYAYNNLFWRSSVLFSDNWGSSPNTPGMYIRDNVFDNCSASTGGYSPSSSYNGYVNTTALTGSAGNDETTASFTYNDGPLGRFYHQSTTFLDQGSRTSPQAGLYHFTTQTNQFKEASSQVDIGFHYPPVGPTTEGLVGYWKLDETSGTTAADSSSNGRNGTTSGGPTWTSAKEANGLQLDGSNDSVSVADHASLRLNNMTIAFWMKKSAEASLWARIIGKGVIGNRNYGVWDDIGASPKIMFQFQDTASTYQNLVSDSSLSLNVWYHVTCTWNGSAASIYINGALDKAQTLTGTPRTSADALVFGFETGNPYFPGTLDEVRIYNRALSGTEIYSLYLLEGNNTERDIDRDGLPDYLEDTDGDGTYDSGETYFTNADSDGDGMSDGNEIAMGLDPSVNQAAQSSTRRNYNLDLLDRIDAVTGKGAVNPTLDDEGNPTSIVP